LKIENWKAREGVGAGRNEGACRLGEGRGGPFCGGARKKTRSIWACWAGRSFPKAGGAVVGKGAGVEDVGLAVGSAGQWVDDGRDAAKGFEGGQVTGAGAFDAIAQLKRFGPTARKPAVPFPE